MIKDQRTKEKRPLMIVADIDGTIVDNDHEMSDHTREVLIKAHEKGIILGIASGRPLEKRLLDSFYGFGLPFRFDFIIGLNGGQLWDQKSDEIETYYPLSAESSAAIIEIMKPYEDRLTVHVYEDGCMWCTREDELMRMSSIRNNMELKIVPVEAIASRSNSKIMFRGDQEVIEEAAVYARKYDNERFRSFMTQPIMLEFQDPRADKGTALKDYCEKQGIALSDVWTFGDMSNDNGLLEVAGRGVCMINGGDDTKAVADEISEYSNDEDGFARYLEAHIEL